MGRPQKPPRLYLDPSYKEGPTWVIRHLQRKFGTGCLEQQRELAEEALRAFDPVRAGVFKRKKRGLSGTKRDIGEIYFISRPDDPAYPVKIGFSLVSTYHRLKNIQVGSPHRLVVLAACRAHHSIEREMHDRLEPFRILGEWFERNEHVMSALAAAQAGGLVAWLRPA